MFARPVARKVPAELAGLLLEAHTAIYPNEDARIRVRSLSNMGSGIVFGTATQPPWLSDAQWQDAQRFNEVTT